MKSKMLRLFLAGVLVFQVISGAVWASEFSDGIINKEEIVFMDEIEEPDLIMEDGYVVDEEIICQETVIDETENSGEQVAEDYEFAIFTDENAEMLTAADENSEELIEAVESGEVFAVAPVSITDLQTSDTVTVSSDNIVTMASVPDTSYQIFSGNPLYCDEIWTLENSQYPCIENGASYNDYRYRQCTVYRTIKYTDANGKTRTSLMYCLEASKTGVNGGEEGVDVVEGALSVLSNSAMKKILYFGYGGPGDSCSDYDPTCSHIDWSKNANRFLFTHYALSKIYSGDLGFATEEEVEHVGLNKFIAYMKSLTIPDRKGVRLSAEDAEGNLLTGTKLNVDLSLYRTVPEKKINGLSETFSDGYQITPLFKVTDEGGIGNGVILKSSDSDTWQIIYWKSEEEYVNTRGPQKPRILASGNSVTLKDGACFRIVFPKEMSGKKKLTYEMSLYPMSFLVLSGEIQKGGTGYQDMGTYVYQDTRGSLQLTVNAAEMGDIQVKKTSDYDGCTIENVLFKLTAMQNLYSGLELIYEKGTLIEQGKTDENGEYLFENLVPGKYYLEEVEAAEGFVSDNSKYELTVNNNEIIVKNITNIPELQGYVEIEKYVTGTKLRLKDAQFMIYEWNESAQNYDGNVQEMKYDDEQKKYVSSMLTYTKSNKGRFKIVETKNPQGYSGNWDKEIVLLNESDIQVFSFKVENSLAEKKVIEIQKVCAESGKNLSDAQFTVFEYSKSKGNYYDNGACLSFDEVSNKYVSETLEITTDNEGKYKIVETGIPEGYTGSWEQEINLLDITQPLQFVVKNTPVHYPKGEVTIKKTDVLTGEILKDASFSIYAWDVSTNTYLENPFDCLTMNYDVSKQMYFSGELEINPQNGGRYKIVETQNPSGYTGSWEQEIVMTAENRQLHYDVTNDPVDLPLGIITVVKKINKNDIVWAHGNPIFHFVIEGIDLQGKYHKYENYIRFTANNYTLDSEGYASLSCNFSKIPLGTYQIYEKNVLRYYLKDVYANTSNVSIIKTDTPAYGKNPKDIAYGQSTLSAENEKASITFVNEKKRYDDYSHNSIIKNVMPAVSITDMEAFSAD